MSLDAEVPSEIKFGQQAIGIMACPTVTRHGVFQKLGAMTWHSLLLINV